MEAPAPFAALTADSGSDLDLRIRIHLRLGSVRIWITLFEPQKPAGMALARAANEPYSVRVGPVDGQMQVSSARCPEQQGGGE